MVTGPDRLAVLNADGSFNNPLVERYLLQLIIANTGAGSAGLVDYAQVEALPGYPTTGFAPAAHGHTIGAISGITPIGSAVLIAGNTDEVQSAIGLDQVDNTADSAKPISAAQAAINAAKADLVGGTVPLAQLRSDIPLSQTADSATGAGRYAMTTAQRDKLDAVPTGISSSVTVRYTGGAWPASRPTADPLVTVWCVDFTGAAPYPSWYLEGSDILVQDALI